MRRSIKRFTTTIGQAAYHAISIGACIAVAESASDKALDGLNTGEQP